MAPPACESSIQKAESGGLIPKIKAKLFYTANSRLA